MIFPEDEPHGLLDALFLDFREAFLGNLDAFFEAGARFAGLLTEVSCGLLQKEVRVAQHGLYVIHQFFFVHNIAHGNLLVGVGFLGAAFACSKPGAIARGIGVDF